MEFGLGLAEGDPGDPNAPISDSLGGKDEKEAPGLGGGSQRREAGSWRGM